MSTPRTPDGAKPSEPSPALADGALVTRDDYDHAEEIKAVPLRHPWRWVFIGVIAVLAAMLINSMVKNPNYDWDLVWKYIYDQRVVEGIRYTLILSVGAMAIALIVGVTIAVMRMSDNPVVSGVAWLYLWVFRGTPVYTQLIFWGLLGVLIPKIGIGIPFGPTFVSWDTQQIITPFVAALFGLALNEAAYMAEIVRAGLLSVDGGQQEAAAALGMSTGKTMSRIVLPQAMRVIVPPTGNEFISMLKTTSLVLAVPFTLELQAQTKNIAVPIFKPIPLLIVAAFWYLVITSILMVGQFYLERYFGRGSNRVPPLTPMQKLKLRLGIGAPPKREADPKAVAIDPDAEISIEQIGPKG